MKYDLHHGDCLEVMAGIPDHSVDLILCDPPYGTTKAKWDSVIPLDKMWEQYKRVIRHCGAIVLFSQLPFDKVLACSNLEWLKYEWIWEKPNATGFFNADYAPMKCHETILVFSDGAAAPLRDESMSMTFRPQFWYSTPYSCTRKPITRELYAKTEKNTTTESDGRRFPRDVIEFGSERGLHPTQKPVPLLAYLIRTYTDKGDLVLDNCMGSGSTGVACVETDRDFIGIEKEEKYYRMAKERIEARRANGVQQDLFNG